MIDYQEFSQIFNKHIFEGEKNELLKKIIERPERFLGLFRPSKPGIKILQHLLQSHEIKFGNAIEELLEVILKDLGFTILPKLLSTVDGTKLSIDHFFTDGKSYYFIEQKIRDDHDSTKKRGQIGNFQAKLEQIMKIYKKKIIGIMYFVDPDLVKNKNYYSSQLSRLTKLYKVQLYLFYGEELFNYLRSPYYWNALLEWLVKWKENLPELPEINFDIDPQESFDELKDLENKYWEKLLENEKLWEAGIIKALFKTGDTLKILLRFFSSQTNSQNLYKLLEDKLKKYY
jgi:hypothetical protein